ncbi:MAG TPA: alpha/beta hydrolase [Burkholderiaceae bacterium]|nr:alpha/beta hydrolase [Burkholderiaceae bacterium]
MGVVAALALRNVVSAWAWAVSAAFYAPLGFAQATPPATTPSAPIPPKAPPCTYCKDALQNVDTLRKKLPADWTLELERDPVFRGDILVIQAGRADAPTVLLVHGLGQNALADWIPLMPQLARRYHVIAVDLPGYGYSTSPLGKYSPKNYARVLQEVLARHAKGPAIVVGHSMGGAVALRLASDYPATTSRLVLVDVAGILHRTTFVKHTATDLLPIENLPGVLKEPVTRIKDFGRAAVERVFGLPNDPTRVLRQSDLAWELILRNRTNVNAALALMDEDFSAAIHTLRQPTQIIWGEADTIAPVRTARVLARRVPNVQLKTMAGIGHTPMEMAPDHFLALLNAALVTDPAPAAPSAQAPPDTNDLKCSGQVDRQYGGHYREIVIENCTAVRLVDVSAEKIVIRDSIVQMLNVQVRGADVALDATNSEVIVTASDLSGEIAVRADASRLDFAGVSLLALETPLEVKRRSRVIASVSQIHSPDYDGYWHDSVELEDARFSPERARP